MKYVCNACGIASCEFNVSTDEYEEAKVLAVLNCPFPPLYLNDGSHQCEWKEAMSDVKITIDDLIEWTQSKSELEVLRNAAAKQLVSKKKYILDAIREAELYLNEKESTNETH